MFASARSAIGTQQNPLPYADRESAMQGKVSQVDAATAPAKNAELKLSSKRTNEDTNNEREQPRAEAVGERVRPDGDGAGPAERRLTRIAEGYRERFRSSGRHEVLRSQCDDPVGPFERVASYALTRVDADLALFFVPKERQANVDRMILSAEWVHATDADREAALQVNSVQHPFYSPRTKALEQFSAPVGSRAFEVADARGAMKRTDSTLKGTPLYALQGVDRAQMTTMHAKMVAFVKERTGQDMVDVEWKRISGAAANKKEGSVRLSTERTIGTQQNPLPYADRESAMQSKVSQVDAPTPAQNAPEANGPAPTPTGDDTKTLPKRSNERTNEGTNGPDTRSAVERARARPEANRRGGSDARWWIETPEEPIQPKSGRELDSVGRARAIALTLAARRNAVKDVAEGRRLTQIAQNVGFCCKCAAEAAFHDLGDMVIGATTRASGARIWHAVVMRDGMVYDATFGRWFEKDVYEQLDFTPARALTPAEVRQFIKDSKGVAPDAQNLGMGDEPQAKLSTERTIGTQQNPLPYANRESVKPGQWYELDTPDNRGTPIAQVREMAAGDLYLPELDERGRLQPEKRGYLPEYVAAGCATASGHRWCTPWRWRTAASA